MSDVDPEVRRLRERLASLEAELEVTTVFETRFRTALVAIELLDAESPQGKIAAKALGD
jgi:hypothetical protein